MPYSDADMVRIATTDQELEDVRHSAKRLGVFYHELADQKVPESIIEMLMMTAATAEIHICGRGDG